MCLVVILTVLVSSVMAAPIKQVGIVSQAPWIEPSTSIEWKAIKEKLSSFRQHVRETMNVFPKTESRQNMNWQASEQKTVFDRRDSIVEINERSGLSDYLYQGDIRLTVNQLDVLDDALTSNATRIKRQAIQPFPGVSELWDGTVSYYFDSSLSPAVRDVFLKAVETWRSNTCINFVENSEGDWRERFDGGNPAKNRIRVISGNGCWSNIGRTGDEQDLSLGVGCEYIGTAIHEVGHALGFFHEQARSDRNAYINVNYANIKQTPITNNNFGVPYDYGSVMQYGQYIFSSNGNPTMTATQPAYQDTMGSQLISFHDIQMMNTLYGCTGRCPMATSAKCSNGGFPDPRLCSTCICPFGYGGRLCNQRPAGCGAVLTATNTFKTMTNVIGNGLNVFRPDFDICQYWIQAPAGERLEIRIKSFIGNYVDGCYLNGVEIKTTADRKQTGLRFCSLSDAGKVLYSTTNLVPVITFNSYFRSTTEILYRIVPKAASPTIDIGNMIMNKDESTDTEVATWAHKCVNKIADEKCVSFETTGLCDDVETAKMCPKTCGLC